LEKSENTEFAAEAPGSGEQTKVTIIQEDQKDLDLTAEKAVASIVKPSQIASHVH